MKKNQKNIPLGMDSLFYLWYITVMKNEDQIVQGKKITEKELKEIRELLARHPEWNRTRLSRELSRQWSWRKENGQLKDMACRSLLLKLEERGYVTLPERRGAKYARKAVMEPVLHSREAIEGSVETVQPVRIKTVLDGYEEALFSYLLYRYHYLGYGGTVGENMKYMVYDGEGRPLSCALFGSAAWSLSPRDQLIGWNPAERKQGLSQIANNMRLLVLPWVRVKNLMSYVLAGIARRISMDWKEKYAHPIYLLESFVDRERYQGACYKAANWQYVGQTTGRSRNGRADLKVSRKDVYVYPLHKQYATLLRRGRQALC